MSDTMKMTVGGAELEVGNVGQCQENAYGYADEAEETEAVRDAPLDR